MDFDDIPLTLDDGEKETGVNIIILRSENEDLRFEKEMERSRSGRQLYLRSLDRTIHQHFLGNSVDDRPHYSYTINIEVVPETTLYELREAGYTQIS